MTQTMIDRFRILFAFLLLLIATASFATPRPAQTVLTISGMYCGSCASGISAMLKRTAGVVKADVSFEDRRAIVDYMPEKTSPEKLVGVIEKMGYKAAI